MNKKQNQAGGKALRYGGYSVIATAIVLAVVVLLNVGMKLLPSTYTKVAIDNQGLYNISDTSRTLVEKVEDEITLYLVCYKDSIRPTIEEYVNRYADMNSNIRVEHVDPAVHPTFLSNYLGEEETVDSSYPNVLVVNESKERHKLISYSEMYSYVYSEEDNYYYQMYGVHVSDPIATKFHLDSLLVCAIHYVTLEKLPVMYYTKGHSEIGLDTYAQAMAAQQNVELKELDLSTAEEVPADADGLLINCPSKDFTADEVAKMTDYANEGGTVILNTYYRSSAEDRSMPNLHGFAETFGLGYQDALVCEGNGSYHVTNYPFAFYPQLGGSFKTWVGSDNVKVISETAHGITVEKLEGVTVTELMTTTTQGFAKTVLPEKGSIVKEEGDAEGKFVVGAYAERKEDGANAKFYWFSTYSVMDVKNTLQYYGNPYLFLGLLVNTCQIQYPTVDPTVLSVEYLTVSAGSATLWGWILIALIPVGVFGGGFLVWQLRRTR